MRALRARVPLLFLAPATGGGHRSAASAVAGALEAAYPGRFYPVMCDPLTGPEAPRVVRQLTRLYGPLTRRAPWAWGALYRASGMTAIMRALQWTLFSGTARVIRNQIEELRPALVVSFHALTNEAAAMAVRASPGDPPVVTVVTDLVSVHRAWRSSEVDCVVAPSAAVVARFRLDGVASERVIETGLPVAAGPGAGKDRGRLRRALGLGEDSFVVVITGGAEGTGRIEAQSRALAKCGWPDLQLVAICGHNRRAERGLRRLGSAQLLVNGFVDNMADWLRCADVVVTRAGPGTLAEATSAGAALLVTSHLPGQEDGNTELAVAAGAAVHVPRLADLTRELARLHSDPMALSAMRQASTRLGRPGAAGEVATLLAALAVPAPGPNEMALAEVLPI